MSMHILLHGGTIAGSARADILVKDGLIEEISPIIEPAPDVEIIDVGGLTLMRAFVDVHVHFREPGRPDKETIRSGSLAAARGGYGTVVGAPDALKLWDTIGENYRRVLGK